MGLYQLFSDAGNVIDVTALSGSPRWFSMDMARLEGTPTGSSSCPQGHSEPCLVIWSKGHISHHVFLCWQVPLD